MRNRIISMVVSIILITTIPISGISILTIILITITIVITITITITITMIAGYYCSYHSCELELSEYFCVCAESQCSKVWLGGQRKY